MHYEPNDAITLVLNYFTEIIRNKVDELYYQSTLKSLEEKSATEIIEGVHFTTYHRMIMLDTNSFLDEYDNYLGAKTEDDFKERIFEVKKVCKPFISQLRKWSDLKRYRDTVIAHNFRDDNRRMVLLNPKLNDLKIPRTILDLLVLRNCIMFTRAIVHQEFLKEFEVAFEELNALPFSLGSPSEIRPENFHDYNYALVISSMRISSALGKRYSYVIDPEER